MSHYEPVEISTQVIPRTPEGLVLPAISGPLHDLAQDAPAIPEGTSDQPDYVFSNDESAAYFDQTRARTATVEYREAGNRTAILIGESSLMANLAFIPEETIILLDSDPAMTLFMQKYIDALRQAPTRAEWGELMGFGTRLEGSYEQSILYDLQQQVIEWHDAGYTHPLDDEELYGFVHEAAKNKAIVPWNGDITDRSDMEHLGAALKASGAHVTMMNLTNVMACIDAFHTAEEYAGRLSYLPLTPNAPILTASTNKKYDLPRTIVNSTGPFFGLQNLSEHGGSTNWRAGGAAIKRQYAEQPAARLTPRASGLVLVEFTGGADKTTIDGIVHGTESSAQGDKGESAPEHVRPVLDILFRGAR